MVKPLPHLPQHGLYRVLKSTSHVRFGKPDLRLYHLATELRPRYCSGPVTKIAVNPSVAVHVLGKHINKRPRSKTDGEAR